MVVAEVDALVDTDVETVVVDVVEETIAISLDATLLYETCVDALSVTRTLAFIVLPTVIAGTFQSHAFDVNELPAKSMFAISAWVTELNT